MTIDPGTGFTPNNETPIKTITGFNFITGTSLSPASAFDSGLLQGMFGVKDSQAGNLDKISPDIYAILALAAAVLGVFASFNKRGKRALPGTILAAGGFIALYMLQSSVKKYESTGDSGLMPIHIKMIFQPGYWICLAAFAITGIISLWPTRSHNRMELTPKMATPIQVNIITQQPDGIAG